MEKEIFLKVKNLSKIYGRRYVLKNINFEIREKGLYLILGPNGAGKTTLFRILSLISFPSAGEIFYFNQKSYGKEEIFLKNIGFLSHSIFLYKDLTGYENLEIVCKLTGIEKEKINKLAEEIECIDYLNKKIKHLSRGQLQRILLLKALIHDPFFLYLDEPFASLDKRGVEILEKIIEKNIKKKIILISSHTEYKIFELARKRFFMEKGEMKN